MKLSSFHRSQGDDVRLLLSYDDLSSFDKVYVSKVFTDTAVPQHVIDASNVQLGGTGFFYEKAPPLPDSVEHAMPDYHLYDDYVRQQIQSGVSKRRFQFYEDYSIGFTTRGCIRGCSFCVNQNYRKCVPHSPVEEFLDPSRKYICLLDDNVLACKEWRRIFDSLNATGKPFQFKQGLDERLLTPEKCSVLFSSNWHGDYLFAFDNLGDRKVIEEKLRMIRDYTDRIPRFYCFCGYNHLSPGNYGGDFWAQDIRDLFERIRILFRYRALPYVMRFKDYVQSPYRGMYVSIARWLNQPNIAKKMTLREFAVCQGEDRSTMRHVTLFERDHPDIAAQYYDMRFGDDI